MMQLWVWQIIHPVEAAKISMKSQACSPRLQLIEAALAQ